MITKLEILNENSIKIILIVLMSLSIFIPTVSFSEMIIAWNEIPPINYVRWIIFIVGGLYIPGSSIFNILFPESTIHERLNVEPFLIKITIYPMISLVYLGIITLILDFFGFLSDFIILFTFFSFIFLFYIDFLFQKKRGIKLKRKRNEIKTSRQTFLILFIGLGIILIALSIHFSSQYLIRGDRWRGIYSAPLIGSPDPYPFSVAYKNYTTYWGYIIFALSKLCGIPYINVSASLFPLLFISITSIYLFVKALLNKNNGILAVLSSIFILIFSELFISISLNQLKGGLWFPRFLILQFSYHSFSYFSFFISIALFFIVINSNNLKNRSNEKIFLLALSSLFLFQSLMTYFFTFLMGIIIVFLYIPFSKNIKQYLRNLLIFYFFFIVFFIIFDFLTFNYFSYIIIAFFQSFLAITLFNKVLFSFYFYTFLLSVFIILFIIYKFSNTLSILIEKTKKKINSILKRKFFRRFLFSFIEIFFLILLIIGLSNPRLGLTTTDHSFDIPVKNADFWNFYLTLLITNMGWIGIFGIFFLYFCFKKNKKLFFFLFSLTILSIGLASSFIFIRWFQYPTSLVYDIPENEFFDMLYFFSRMWIFSAIPLSIFAAIGLIKLINVINTRVWFKAKSYKKFTTPLFFTSILIYFTLSNSIITSIYWDNFSAISNEEAQIIGWSTDNIPYGSKILITTVFFKSLQRDLYLYETFYLQDELINSENNISRLIENLILYEIYYLILPNLLIVDYITLINNFYKITIYKYGSYSIYSSI